MFGVNSNSSERSELSKQVSIPSPLDRRCGRKQDMAESHQAANVLLYLLHLCTPCSARTESAPSWRWEVAAGKGVLQGRESQAHIFIPEGQVLMTMTGGDQEAPCAGQTMGLSCTVAQLCTEGDFE